MDKPYAHLRKRVVEHSVFKAPHECKTIELLELTRSGIVDNQVVFYNSARIVTDQAFLYSRERQMISSVIARFEPNHSAIQQTIDEIDGRDGVETGELANGTALPITIEAADSNELVETTRWIGSRGGVTFVDVVFVHLETE